MRLSALVSSCFAILATLAFATTTARAAQTSRAYHVGNSLTGQAGADHLRGLAAQRGIDVTWGYHIRAGQGLGYMIANPNDVSMSAPSTYPTALPNNAWNVVTLQTYGDTYDTNKSAIQQMINSTRTNAANQTTRFFIYEGWPQDLAQVGGDYSAHWRSTYDPTKPSDSINRLKTWSRGFSDELMSQLHSSAFNSPVDIKRIRSGEVFYQLDQLAEAGQLGSTTGIEQWYIDPYHMNDFGAYTAQLTMFATIYGENPAGLPAPTGMTPEVAATVQQTVWSVVNTDPYSGVHNPEPSGLALLSVGALALLRRYRASRPHAPGSC
jgi:hypothetical protein